MPHLIEQVVDDLLKPAGFRKAGGNWYRDGAEAVLVVNLQRSGWGRAYYLNLGLWLSDLGKVARPKEQNCPIRKRLSGDRLAAALDYDQPLADDERRKQIHAALKRGLGVFEGCETKRGIVSRFKADKLKVDLIDVRAQEVLGLRRD